MIESVHFLKADGGQSVARKLLRVNLSDLAAKGAVPLGYQLVLGMPAPLDEGWLADFAAGLAQDQAAFSFPLYGGDTVRSPGGITLAVTAFGDRKSVVWGKRVSVRVDLGGRRIIKKK